jgi:crotonobetaine/carnitine-CoA ligase
MTAQSRNRWREREVMSVDKSEWTIVDLVRRQAAAHGEREYMAFEHGTSLTFAGLDRDSDAVARNLAALGVATGDRVLALLKNRIEYMVLMIAVMKLGAVYVPVNTELKGAFLQHQLRNCEPKAVFCETELADAFDGTTGGTDELVATVFVAGGMPARMPAVFSGARSLTYEDFRAAPGRRGEVLVTARPADIAMIMYTSGTTGPSKGVLMPHAHLYLFALGTVRSLRITSEDVYYVSMPVFHINALGMQVLGSLFGGARIYCVERFSPNRWLEDVRKSGATLTNALGVMPEFIWRTDVGEDDADNSLRMIMAIPVANEWSAAFERRFGVKIRQGFGMTECNIPCYSRDDDPLETGCAGHIEEDFFELKIVDPDTDMEVPRDQVGEIVIRPKEPSCFMQGYYRMPEKTVEAWRNLWFHTGDAGRLTEDGLVYFIDRIKDCIRRRGENISSFEVEQVLNEHPAVSESAVVGIKVEGAGGEEEVKACIVAADGAVVDNVALLDYCVANMPRFAVPRYIETMPALDKTASGKIQKEALRKAGISGHTWDRESVGYTITRR